MNIILLDPVKKAKCESTYFHILSPKKLVKTALTLNSAKAFCLSNPKRSNYTIVEHERFSEVD